MAQKGKKKKFNQRGPPFQQQQPSRIQTITSTSSHIPQLLPQVDISQPPPLFSAPAPQYTVTGPPPPRPKIHVNPHFRGARPQQVPVHSQPTHLMYDGPPRSQPMSYHQEPPARHFQDHREPPPRHFQDHPRPLVS